MNACHICGENVEQPLERGGQYFHPSCWLEFGDEREREETPEEAREALLDLRWDEERERELGYE